MRGLSVIEAAQPSPLVALDGRQLARAHEACADVVVVGSGPAGASVARACARAGLDVLMVEEGHEAKPESFPKSGLQAMARWYRDLGTSVAFGPAIIPFLQGKAVGGTSVVNGAINWRLPHDVWQGWVRADPALADALPWERYRVAEEELAACLGVQPTDERVAGEKNLLLARGAEALGLEHRPIERNVERCRGLGRCLQGCPEGNKRSVDRTLLHDAVDAGARVFAGMTALSVIVERGRAVGVRARSAAGAPVTVRARHAVVLAASAIQTPNLLRASGLSRAPVGDGLMAHPGVSVSGRFDHDVDNHHGATQGHEVTGLRHQGIKIEALGFDLSILASRIPGVGHGFAARLPALRRHAVWGAGLRAEARGTVRPGLPGMGGRALVRYALTQGDVHKARRATRVMCELFLAAGALEVYPGVAGLPELVTTREQAARIERDGPLDARAYAMSMTHLFSTARMGSDPMTSVVGLDFQHHDVDGLFVADSSVFPSNTGVNPQLAIAAVAQLAADAIVRAGVRVAA
ncbi:MAG: GMC family oxidoreductase [Deltaproteobacteria bacterium]|nr:GMC family oxidoreductase [Deltaproteobacteria bacterium]